jgi:hypothetical protein
MVSLVQLWLPILLSAVGAFVASSIVHMALHKLWHGSDYHGFSNEDEVRAAIRKGSAAPGMYMMPWHTMEQMKDPAIQAKFSEGPVGLLMLRAPGSVNMGKSLGLWFGFCLLVAIFAGYIAGATLPAGTAPGQVFCIITTAAFMGFGFGTLPNHIWWGEPLSSSAKNLVDGVIYAVVTGAVFMWLWPHAG